MQGKIFVLIPDQACVINFYSQIGKRLGNTILSIILKKYVLSTMGVSKESISKFLIGNRFHVKLRILSPENFKQSLQVKS